MRTSSTTSSRHAGPAWPGGRSWRGFTLVELLVVIGIIALLVSILLPTLGAARRSAQDVKCLTILRQLGTANITYSINNDNWVIPERIGIKDKSYLEFKWWFQIRQVGEYMAFDEELLNNSQWAWPLDYYCPSVEPDDTRTSIDDTGWALDSYHMNTTNLGFPLWPWQSGLPAYKTYARGFKISKVKESSSSAQFTDFANGNQNNFSLRNNYKGERTPGAAATVQGIAWRHGDAKQKSAGKANAVFYDGHGAPAIRGDHMPPKNDLSREVLRFWGPIGPNDNPVQDNVIRY